MKTPVIWMPVYVADVDTVAKGLTAEQEGIFHRLMRIYWVEGKLPDEDRLPLFLQLSPQKWRAVRDIVFAAFQAYCERIDMNAQRERSAKFREAQRVRKSNYWKQKHSQDATQGLDTTVEPALNPSPSPSHSKVSNREETFIQGSGSSLDVEHYGEGRASTRGPEAPRLMNGSDYGKGRH
jgi:uncharacterized protein YdaU (DUF1376 family)